MVLLLALHGALEHWELAVVAVLLCDPLVALFSADLFLHLYRLTGPRGCQAAMLPSAVGRHQTPFPALLVTFAGTAAANRDQIWSCGEMTGQLLSYQDCQEQVCKTSCKDPFPGTGFRQVAELASNCGFAPTPSTHRECVPCCACPTSRKEGEKAWDMLPFLLESCSHCSFGSCLWDVDGDVGYHAVVAWSAGILLILSASQQHKLLLADGIHGSVSAILRKYRMASVGNELFSMQDVLLMNKIRVSSAHVFWGPALLCLSTLSGSTAADAIGFFVSGFVVISNRACVL